MHPYRLVIATLLLAAALVLSGCDFGGGSQGQAATTSPPSTDGQPGAPNRGEVTGEAPDNARLAVTVEEEPFTLADLEAMPQIQVSAGGETYEGVSILDLLAAARITDVLTITLVARDAVTVELEVPSLTSESILALGPDDVLNAILPEIEPERWLQDVVVIDTEPEARIALTVGEHLFAFEELQTMQAVEVEAGDETYEGVRILDLLSATGRADAVTVILLDRLGESVEVPVKDLTAESILAFGEEENLQAVLPGLADSYWLPDVVEIRTTP